MEHTTSNKSDKVIEIILFITTTCYVYILISLFFNTHNTSLIAVIAMAISFFMKEKGVLFLMITVQKILCIKIGNDKKINADRGEL